MCETRFAPQTNSCARTSSRALVSSSSRQRFTIDVVKGIAPCFRVSRQTLPRNSRFCLSPISPFSSEARERVIREAIIRRVSHGIDDFVVLELAQTLIIASPFRYPS